jgi:hypothetical protein
MKRPPRQSPALASVERQLARGAWRDALLALLPELDARAADGDHACALAARLLRAQDSHPATPDALAAALDRLVALVERQEAQIRALQALVEDSL